MKQQEQFDKLYTISQKKLFNVAYSVTKNREQAEDVLQDAYIKAWKHFSEYDDSKKFTNWMTTIVRNTAIDSNRTKSRKDKTVTLSSLTTSKKIFQIEDESSNPNTIMRKSGNINELYKIISTLPDDLREIMIRLASGDSYKEISEIEQLPVAVIRQKVHRAKKILRNYAQGVSIAETISYN